MNKKRAYLLIGLLAFIIGLIKFAPATIISQYIANKTANIILLSNAQGTIWQGHAELAISSDQTNALTLGPIDWDIKATRLLLGELNIAIHWNNSESMTLTMTPTQLSIANLNIELPANAFSTLVPSLSAAQLGGQLRISTSSFNVTHLNNANLKPNFTGQIQLDWQQASSRLSAINPLGQYKASINGVNDQIFIKVATQNGPLILEGDGILNQENGLLFSGSASAENNQKQALTPLLHVLGNEAIAGNGRYKINFGH